MDTAAAELAFLANGDLTVDGLVLVGADGAGTDVTFHGSALNEKWLYDADDNTVAHKDSAGANIYRLGGDATTEYALDVTDGANNINKVRASAFVTYSDRALKTDITPMSDSLSKVMKLGAVSYKLKSGGTEAPREIGFLAQDVAAVVPEVCAFDATGESRGIDYSRMSALLADAVKSQQEQIAQLKEIVAKLQK